MADEGDVERHGRQVDRLRLVQVPVADGDLEVGRVGAGHALGRGQHPGRVDQRAAAAELVVRLAGPRPDDGLPAPPDGQYGQTAERTVGGSSNIGRPTGSDCSHLLAR